MSGPAMSGPGASQISDDFLGGMSIDSDAPNFFMDRSFRDDNVLVAGVVPPPRRSAGNQAQARRSTGRAERKPRCVPVLAT
jgi:hypothetical protein